MSSLKHSSGAAIDMGLSQLLGTSSLADAADSCGFNVERHSPPQTPEAKQEPFAEFGKQQIFLISLSLLFFSSSFVTDCIYFHSSPLGSGSVSHDCEQVTYQPGGILCALGIKPAAGDRDVYQQLSGWSYDQNRCRMVHL